MKDTFNASMFPESADNAVAWAPVMVEPVMGSGERITVGVAFVNGKGHRFQQTLKPAQIRTLFGKASGEMLQLVAIVHAEFERHVKDGGSLDDIRFPLSGFHLGRIHHVNANSVAELMDSAMMMSSAFVAMPEHDAIEVDNEEEKGLNKQIRTVVKLRKPELTKYMGTKLRLRKSSSELRFGFAGQRLAANFGRITPGQGLNIQVVHAKSKILDLATLRRFDEEHSISQMTDTDRHFYELMVLRPPTDADYFPKKQLESWNAVIDQLEYEADKSDVQVVPFERTEDLAARIVKQESYG